MIPMIKVADGYNGSTVRMHAEPFEVDGDLIKLRCAEPGLEYCIRWIHRTDYRSALRVAGLDDTARYMV